ncbi:MAG: PilZ domain-containing protein [Phycisphaeraceae bacterium]
MVRNRPPETDPRNDPRNDPPDHRRHPRKALPVGYAQVRVRLPGQQRYSLTGHAYDISLSGIRFELDQSIPLGKAIDMQLSLPTPTPGSTPGSTPAPGMKVNLAGMNADVKATLSDMPTASLDALAKQNGLIAAALGDKVTLGANATLRGGKGPVTATIDSPLAKAKIPARMDAGVLTLTDTMTASFMLTEQLSRKLIDHPLLKQAIRSERPVTLVVAKEGFRLPVSKLMSGDEAIKQEGIEQWSIGKATIDPGKMVVSNAGLIKTLVMLPQVVGNLVKGGKSERSGNELIAWFTPMDVSMKDGVVTMSRLDMLIGENYQVATWGALNMSGRQVTALEQKIPAKCGYMVLGITERALRRVYGVSAFRDDPNYVDQFIMAGPLDKLGPDEKELKLRMAFLTGGGSAANVMGSETGDIVGGAMKVGGVLQSLIDKKKRDQKPAPVPHLPYPWPPEAKPTDQQQTGQQNQPTAPTDSPRDQPAPQPQKKRSPEEKLINDVFDLLGKKKK